MSQKVTGILAALAVSLTLGAMQFASGHDLTVGLATPGEPAGPSVNGAPTPKLPIPSHGPTAVKPDARQAVDPAFSALFKSALEASHPGPGKIPKILSGPITPAIVASNLPHTPKTDPTISEILNAAA